MPEIRTKYMGRCVLVPDTASVILLVQMMQAEWWHISASKVVGGNGLCASWLAYYFWWRGSGRVQWVRSMGLWCPRSPRGLPGGSAFLEVKTEAPQKSYDWEALVEAFNDFRVPSVPSVQSVSSSNMWWWSRWAYIFLGLFTESPVAGRLLCSKTRAKCKEERGDSPSLWGPSRGGCWVLPHPHW